MRLAHVKSMHQENEWDEVRLAMHALCQSLQRDGTKWTSIWLNLRPLQKILYNANLIKFSSVAQRFSYTLVYEVLQLVHKEILILNQIALRSADRHRTKWYVEVESEANES